MSASGFVALFSYMNIVYAYLYDLLILHESLNAIELIAALTILIVALLIGCFKIRQSKLAKTEESNASPVDSNLQ